MLSRFWKRHIITALLALTATMGVHAAEKKIAITDYTGRGFAPDVVTYRVDGATAKQLRLFDAAGQPLAAQTRGLRKGELELSFVTDLPAGATREFLLRDDGKGAAPATAVSAKQAEGALVLANGLFAVKVPAAQEKSFKEPVAASTLPAPLLGFRGAGETAWRGSGKILATRPVKTFKVALVDEGPVFCEVRYELEFAAGGFYRATIRVEDRVPVAKISEDYDPGVMDGTDAWELDLVTNWAPDRMEIARTNGNGSVDAGHVESLEKLKEKPSWYLVPDSAWGAPLSQLGLFAEAAQKANPASYPMAGIVPLHKGDWRQMNALEIQSTGPADVRVRLPMSRRYASWLREVTSETSPFSMHEHEPGLAKTYSRRHWGLVLATPALETKGESGKVLGPFYQARLFYGVVGLDRYKDFVLAWPDTGVSYPRVYLKAADVEKYKRELQASVLPEEFKKKLLTGVIALGADDQATQARVKSVRNNLNYICSAVLVSPTTGHHWTAPNYMTASAADDVLGWKGLPAADRAEFRAKAALICYLWEEADVISYANGSHPGNPNMGTARFSPMVSFLPLVPDHPMSAKWGQHMSQYLEYKATTQMAPGGGYFEYGAAYHMHGYARVMNVIPALQAAGVPVSAHLLEADRQNWSYYLNLLSPVESRWKYRIFPGLANSPPGYTENLLEAAGELAPRDPELAANLLWAWLANGANGDAVANLNSLLAPVGLAPKEPAFKSEIYPGIGVIFRAHQGPDETYMFLRSGNHWSHWTEDQGNFMLMSRGATLLPFQSYQYWSVKNKEFDDKNVLHFGHPENKIPHAWPDSNILDHAFGPTVDYARSSTGYPDWYIQPGAMPEFGGKVDAPVGSGGLRKLAEGSTQKQGAFDWDRQILFLKGKTGKSPNYFVIRDSVTGEGQLASWLYLNTLGTKEDVKISCGNLLVDSEWPVKLEVCFPQLAAVKPEFYEERQFVSLGGYSGPSWWRKDGPISRNWADKDGKPVPEAKAKTQSPDFWEQHSLLRLAAAPGAGDFWLLYPRTAEEAAPVVSAPAPGVMKIAHPEGTDYVFLAAAPFSYEAEGVVFAGSAGTVRIAKDGTVTLALSAGAGKIGYKGAVLSGTAPFEKVFKPGETVAAASAPAVADEARVVKEGNTVRFIAPAPVYVKLTSGNVGVRGVGPFDLTFTADGITGTVERATRTLVTTIPEKIRRPMYHLDGNRWYAGWADDHSIIKGTATPQFGIGFGVTAGKHTVEIREWTYPALPPVPARARVAF